LCKHVSLSKYIGKTIFVEFLCIYGILYEPKRLSFKSQKNSFQASASRLTSRLILKSVNRIGRPTCTDVHAFVHWRDGRPTRSTAPESFCSLEFSVDPSVDRQRVLLSAPVARSTVRSTLAPTVRFMTVGGRPTRSTGRPDRPQRLYFSGL